tara:strand:+ start:133 stop:309 length:177 start_codon:yes stop_codon:yes gene_type:complete
MKIKEDLMDILNDHKSNLIVMVDEAHASATTFGLDKEVEMEHERMITEVNELLGSTYE